MVAAFETCVPNSDSCPPPIPPLPTSHSDDKFSKCLKKYFKSIKICLITQEQRWRSGKVAELKLGEI
jgi:hypothetical protein